MSQSPTRLLIAALVIVCVALVGVLVQANMPEDKASQPAQEQAVTQNDATPSATDDSQETSLDSLAAGETIGNVLGSKNPDLVIHEYTDYQCPYCALSLGNFLRLVKEMKNVQVVHHDYPLNAECNPSIQGKGHAYACVASRYARAAEKQGKFWDLSVLLYLNQRQLSEEKILSLAESIGLDTKKLKQDADSAQLKQELAKDVEAANTVQKIEGTPTMFIEGNRYQGVMPYDELKALVQAHLRGEKPEPPKED